jgi:hypothetical protein
MDKTLDGITGPNGECTCSHCQMDNMIDSIVAVKEYPHDQKMVDVYEQVGE